MLEWILSASFLILAIIVLRRIFKGKISRRLQYALWGLVLLRLLVPVSLFSASFSPAAAVSEKIVTSDYATPLLSPITAGTGGGEASAPQASGVPAAARFDYGRAAMAVWYWGMGITAAVFLFTNFSFYMRLRRSRRRLDGDFPLRVYICDGLDSPCLLGGSIYITPEMAGDETKLRHVLAHEYTHYRHLDGLWSILRCAAVSLHWYNPLVWWAAGLSKRDGELACDEGAVKALGEDERLSYGRTLIELTVSAAPAKNILCCATTMADGKKAIKERIEMISKNPKHIIVTAVTVILICALAAGCAFSGAKADPVEEPENSMNLTDPTDIRDDGSKIYYLPMTIEGVEEEVPAKLHVLGSASIIVPEEGWQKTEEADGTGVKFIPDANKDVCVSIDRYKSTDVDSLVNTLGEKYGQPLPSEPSAYLQGVMGWSADSFSFDGSIVSLYAAQCYGDSYVLTLSYPDDAESREGWGTRVKQIGCTISYPKTYLPQGLTADTTTGVAVFLDYADDDIVIFHGYFGLFVYDLERQEIIGAFDLEKAVGTTNVQGSVSAGIQVSADGKTIELCRYNEGAEPDNVLFIDTATMEITQGEYRELENSFNSQIDPPGHEHSGGVAFSDGYAYVNDVDGTLGSLQYVRDDMVWKLFGNYFSD